MRCNNLAALCLKAYMEVFQQTFHTQLHPGHLPTVVCTCTNHDKHISLMGVEGADLQESGTHTEITMILSIHSSVKDPLRTGNPQSSPPLHIREGHRAGMHP